MDDTGRQREEGRGEERLRIDSEIYECHLAYVIFFLKKHERLKTDQD